MTHVFGKLRECFSQWQKRNVGLGMADNVEKRFKLMTVKFDPEPKTAHWTCSSLEQALNALVVPGTPDCFVSVSIFKGNVELGEFDLSRSGCRAEALIFDRDAVAARDPQNTAEGEMGCCLQGRGRREHDRTFLSKPSRGILPPRHYSSGLEVATDRRC